MVLTAFGVGEVNALVVVAPFLELGERVVSRYIIVEYANPRINPKRRVKPPNITLEFLHHINFTQFNNFLYINPIFQI